MPPVVPPPNHVVPDVLNRTEQDAQTLLKQYGYTNIVVKREPK